MSDRPPRRAFYECPVTDAPCPNQERCPINGTICGCEPAARCASAAELPRLAVVDDPAPTADYVLLRAYHSSRPDAAYGPMPERAARWIVEQFTDDGVTREWTILPLIEGPPDA